MASPLRVLLITLRPDEAFAHRATLASVVQSLLSADFAPLALLTQLDWEASLMLITGPPSEGCSRCDLYTKPECAAMFSHSDAFIIPHVQHQVSEGAAVLEGRATSVAQVDLSGFDLVLTLEAVVPQPIIARHPRPFFAHRSVDVCARSARSLPALGYRAYLRSHVAQVDSAEAVATIRFPSSLLYSGVFHALLDLPSLALHNRSSMAVLLSSASEEDAPLGDAAQRVVNVATVDTELSHRLISGALTAAGELRLYGEARLCVFAPGLFDAAVPSSAWERRRVVRRVAHALAMGCVVVASEEVASYTLDGEIADAAGDGDDSLRVLLSAQTTVADPAALLSALRSAQSPMWVDREAAYQAAALNAHMLERPLHFLLQAYSQHRSTWRG